MLTNSTKLRKYFLETLKSGMVINNKTSVSLEKIKDEWKKCIKGKPVNVDIVSQPIYESWQRSMKNGVDPYLTSLKILSSEEIKQQMMNRKSLVQRFGEIIQELQILAREKGLVVQLFDKYGKNIQLLAFTDYSHHELGMPNTVPLDVSETYVGTNAICIALKENKSVQVLGPQHFNYYLHNTFCTAAPIHNSSGEIIGAINIYSYNQQHNLDTLMLVTFLAKLFDNISFISEVLEKLDSYDLFIKRTIEYLPQGILYLNHLGEIQCYNSKIIDLLKIDTMDTERGLTEFISLLNISLTDCLESKEISLNVKNKRTYFLVSTKNIKNPKNLYDDKIILLEQSNKRKEKLLGNEAAYTFNDIIGNNKTLTKVEELAKKVAKASTPVLLYGESGTGKELFAQAIHNSSLRKDKPFVAINCGAIPSELVESELFGYEPGSFTGAQKNGKLGKFEIAFGGTIFLDEIESMPMNTQVKLLRSLSTNKICRVGGVSEIPINVRVISATKKDLLDESDNGNFREDLYYRISTITLNLPPLRNRTDDIPLLVDHFIKQLSGEFGLEVYYISDEFFKALSFYHWRGNVRELYNVIERAIVLLDGSQEFTLSHLPEKIIKAYNYKNLRNKISIVNEKSNENNLMKTSEEIIIELLWHQENGNLSKIAERMGISRPTLYNKINASKKLKDKLAKYH